MLKNPFKNLKKHEWILWLTSVFVVAASNFLTGSVQLMTLFSTVIGVTALIFVAKGDVWGQVLTVVSVSYTHLDVYKRQPESTSLTRNAPLLMSRVTAPIESCIPN